MIILKTFHWRKVYAVTIPSQYTIFKRNIYSNNRIIENILSILKKSRKQKEKKSIDKVVRLVRSIYFKQYYKATCHDDLRSINKTLITNRK